jgi:hypothetical protein
LAFITSMSYPATLGSVAAYDASCNEIATAAGINTTTGIGYIAGLGTTSTSLRDRLQSGVPRGWIRMDRLPFTDDATALFDSNRVYYPVRYDERGAARPSMLTGLRPDGTTDAAFNCEDWSTNAPDALIVAGSATGGHLAGSQLALATSSVDGLPWSRDRTASRDPARGLLLMIQPEDFY